MTRRVLLVLLSIVTSACTHVADRYSSSADNVASIRATGAKAVHIGAFSTAPNVAQTEIQCAGVAIAPPDNMSFADYIRSALIAELKMANLYSSTSAASVSGTLRALRVDASAFSLTGQWFIELELQGNGKSLAITELYTFRSQTLNMTSCEGAARRLGSAVQDLVGKIVQAPDFSSLIRSP